MTISNIEMTWSSAGALILLAISLFMIGCGVNVCWLRFSRRGAKEREAVTPRRW